MDSDEIIKNNLHIPTVTSLPKNPNNQFAHKPLLSRGRYVKKNNNTLNGYLIVTFQVPNTFAIDNTDICFWSVR